MGGKKCNKHFRMWLQIFETGLILKKRIVNPSIGSFMNLEFLFVLTLK